MPPFVVCRKAHDHPKFNAAGNAAIGAWTRMGSWCCDYRDDGFVPDDTATRYASKRELARLLECGGPGQAGLLVKVEGGYRFHDWDDIRSRFLVELAGTTEQEVPADLSAKRAEAGRRGAMSRWQPSLASVGNGEGKPDSKADGKTSPLPGPLSPESPDLGSEKSERTHTLTGTGAGASGRASHARPDGKFPKPIETPPRVAFSTPTETRPTDLRPGPLVGNPNPVPLSPEALRLLAELRRHPCLAPVTSEDIASELATNGWTAGKSVELMMQAIRELAGKAGIDAAAGHPWDVGALRAKLVSFVMRARPRDDGGRDGGGPPIARPESERIDVGARQRAKQEARARLRTGTGGGSK